MKLPQVLVFVDKIQKQCFKEYTTVSFFLSNEIKTSA